MPITMATPTGCHAACGLYIQDEASFFRVFEAFVKSEALGSLQRVWNLASTFKRRRVWPELQFIELETSDHAADIFAVAPFYPAVVFVGVNDNKLMQSFLTPSTPVAWHSSTRKYLPKPWDAWYSRLATLNLVLLHEEGRADTVDVMVAHLPQYMHLQSIELAFCRVFSLTPILQFVRHLTLTTLAPNYTRTRLQTTTTRVGSTWPSRPSTFKI
ncbi:Aste57867_9699 [Aphanomyces stellatus]|uniref:Aste57867_9699 protein n=1 Tax=Aphanomyces stellatus TaxID=120398 RepID=A0A485KNT2_9STRA|nr:hypothetical protein As57867_009661 [Aphanomyces stellatus]VFT86578.1 Aste57867_9699 [Aphanomyces stellatus]